MNNITPSAALIPQAATTDLDRMGPHWRGFWHARAVHHWEHYWNETVPELRRLYGKKFNFAERFPATGFVTVELQREGLAMATADLVRDLLREEILAHRQARRRPDAGRGRPGRLAAWPPAACLRSVFSLLRRIAGCAQIAPGRPFRAPLR